MSAAWRRRHRDRGQAVLEFSLSAVFLVLLLAGAAQMAALYYDSMSVETAAREAARVAAENPQSSSLFSSPNTPASPGTHTCSGSTDSNIVCAAAYKSTYKSPDGLIDPSQLSVSLRGSVYTGSSPTTCSSGVSTSDGLVTVTVSYNAPIFIPFLNKVLATPGDTYRTLTTTLSIRVEPCDVTAGN